MLSSKIGLLPEFLYSVLRSRIMICFILWIEVVLCLRHILHGTQWTKIRRPSRGNGYHSKPRCHFLPSAVKMADNVDKTDRKEDEHWSRFNAFKGGKRVFFYHVPSTDFEEENRGSVTRLKWKLQCTLSSTIPASKQPSITLIHII